MEWGKELEEDEILRKFVDTFTRRKDKNLVISRF